MTLSIIALVIYLIGLGYCIYLVDKLGNRAKEATKQLIAIWTILEQEGEKCIEDLREGRTDDFHKGRYAELSHLIDEFSKIENNEQFTGKQQHCGVEINAQGSVGR